MSIKMEEEELKKLFDQFEDFDHVNYSITKEDFFKFLDMHFK